MRAVSAAEKKMHTLKTSPTGNLRKCYSVYIYLGTAEGLKFKVYRALLTNTEYYTIWRFSGGIILVDNRAAYRARWLFSLTWSTSSEKISTIIVLAYSKGIRSSWDKVVIFNPMCHDYKLCCDILWQFFSRRQADRTVLAKWSQWSDNSYSIENSCSWENLCRYLQNRRRVLNCIEEGGIVKIYRLI